MTKSIRQLRPDYSGNMDNENVVKHVCECGSFVWNVKASFDNYELVSYFVDMECAACGSYALAPTPLDRDGCEV